MTKLPARTATRRAPRLIWLALLAAALLVAVAAIMLLQSPAPPKSRAVTRVAPTARPSAPVRATAAAPPKAVDLAAPTVSVTQSPDAPVARAEARTEPHDVVRGTRAHSSASPQNAAAPVARAPQRARPAQVATITAPPARADTCERPDGPERKAWCMRPRILAADQRVRLAYAEASRIGVRADDLTMLQRRWTGLQREAGSDPDATIRGYDDIRGTLLDLVRDRRLRKIAK